MKSTTINQKNAPSLSRFHRILSLHLLQNPSHCLIVTCPCFFYQDVSSMRLEPLLVCQGCHIKVSQMEWLVNCEKLIFSQFWRPEPEIKVSQGLIFYEASLLSTQMANFSLCLQMVSLCVCLYQNFLFLQGYQLYWIRPRPNDLILT